MKDLTGGKYAKHQSSDLSAPNTLSFISSAMSYHKQWNLFHKQIVDVFDRSSLERLVQFKLGVQLANVATEGPFDAVVFELVQWADREGKIKQLIRAVKNDRPKNSQLQVVANNFLAALPNDSPFLTEALASIATWLAKTSPFETQQTYEEWTKELSIGVHSQSERSPGFNSEVRAQALIEELYEDGDYKSFLLLCTLISNEVRSATNLKEKLDAIANVATAEFRIAMRKAGWTDAAFILNVEGSTQPLRAQPRIGISFPKRSLSLGWRWGLQRGPFVGLISSPPDISVLAHLRDVERKLWYARQFDANSAIPTRWWVQVESTKSLSRTPSVDEFWRHVIAADRNAESFRSQALPTVPGLFFGGACPPADGVVESWCDVIARGKFPFSLPAIVVQFGAGAQERKELKKLVSRLRRILNADIPIEAVSVSGRLDLAPRESSYPRHTPGHEVGMAFFYWLDRIKKFARLERVKDTLDLPDARPLVDAYQSLQLKSNGNGVTADVSAVVADLEQLCLPLNSQACFLQLVKLVLPDRLPGLIAAMAQAPRRETQLLALKLASTNPILCDAWASGASSVFTGLQIKNLPSKPSPATEALALAFMRRLEVDPSSAKRAVDRMRKYLSPETREVWKFLQCGAKSAGQQRLLKQLGWRGMQRAVDAGAELSLDLHSVQQFGLDEPEFWWLLATTTPDTEMLADLLALDARFRAIVGLCTEQESRHLRADAALWNAICHCRRDKLVDAPEISYR